MLGIKDCIDICCAIYSVYKKVVQNKALCAQLEEIVQYCDDILTRQKTSSHSSTTSSSLTQETFQSLHHALRLAEAYMEKYTEKKLGRSIIRAWNVNDDRSKFEEIKEKIDRCIDRLPIVQIMDQDERNALAEKRRMSEFTELKRVINISVEEILNETHDNNEAIIDIIRGFQQDLHQFITNEAGSMFNLKSDELSSLRVDIDNKVAILDARQKEILEILKGTYMYVCMYVCIYMYVLVHVLVHVFVWICIHIYIFICIYLYICICVFMIVCLFVCMSMCMCMCMCVCLFVYLYLIIIRVWVDACRTYSYIYIYIYIF